MNMAEALPQLSETASMSIFADLGSGATEPRPAFGLPGSRGPGGWGPARVADVLRTAEAATSAGHELRSELCPDSVTRFPMTRLAAPQALHSLAIPPALRMTGGLKGTQLPKLVIVPSEQTASPAPPAAPAPAAPAAAAAAAAAAAPICKGMKKNNERCSMSLTSWNVTGYCARHKEQAPQ